MSSTTAIIDTKGTLRDTTTFERHLAVEEIAAKWSLSRDFVRRLFEREPGVLILGNGATQSKRRYRTLRIPQSMAERVHRRLTRV